MDDAIRWYLALAAIGAGGLLPSMLLFGRLRSGGLLYARPLALAGIAVLAWLAAALGIVPWGTPLVAALVAGAWGWSAWLWWRRPDLRAALLARGRILLAGEALFLALFAVVLLARAQAPGAVHTEKPMDLMMLTAVHRAERMPPPDPWFAGERISYYHLGHVQVDAVARLSGNGPGTAFNLGLASAGAMAGVAVFALAGDLLAAGGLRRRASAPVAGAFGVVGLLWLAPVEGLVDLAAANGVGGEGVWGRLGVAGLPGPASTTDGVPDEFWWWWRATRVVPDTIGEFPAFSLLLGDLHAHVLALPLGLTALALAVVAYEGGTPLTWRRWLRAPGAWLLASLLFAGLGMTNSWDVVTFGALWLGAAALAFARAGWPPAEALFGAARHLALPAAGALALGAPFLAQLDVPPLGLAPVAGEHSDPARFLLVWLAPVLPLGVAALALRPRLDRRPALVALAVAVLALLAWALWLLLAGDGGEVTARGAGWVTVAALALGAVALAGVAVGVRGEGAARAAGGWAWLGAAALALLLLTELVRVDDAFPGRLNTVFKLWFHGWALLAVAGGAALGAVVEAVPLPEPGAAMRTASTVAVGVAAALYIGSLLYAPAMAVSRAREGQQPGLDALAEWRRSDPGLVAAAAWARDTLEPDEHVLLQAVGRSYTMGSALSAASAVPTLLGWPNHERQWRGHGPAFDEREQAVGALYAAGAGQEALAIAERWGITHVYVGQDERAQFGDDAGARFEGWPVAFEQDGVRVFAVPGAAVAGAAP